VKNLLDGNLEWVDIQQELMLDPLVVLLALEDVLYKIFILQRKILGGKDDRNKC
jgi:hypothetical protein